MKGPSLASTAPELQDMIDRLQRPRCVDNTTTVHTRAARTHSQLSQFRIYTMRPLRAVTYPPNVVDSPDVTSTTTVTIFSVCNQAHSPTTAGTSIILSSVAVPPKPPPAHMNSSITNLHVCKHSPGLFRKATTPRFLSDSWFVM